MTDYYSPEDSGLRTIGEVDWSDGDYQFDLTVVWQRKDGTFVYGEDSGCSCPSPFEDQTEADYKVGTVDEILAHLQERNGGGTYDRSAEIATLLEAMLKAKAS